MSRNTGEQEDGAVLPWPAPLGPLLLVPATVPASFPSVCPTSLFLHVVPSFCTVCEADLFGPTFCLRPLCHLPPLPGTGKGSPSILQTSPPMHWRAELPPALGAARHSWVCPVSHFLSKASSSPPLSPQPYTGSPVHPTSCFP